MLCSQGAWQAGRLAGRRHKHGGVSTSVPHLGTGLLLGTNVCFAVLPAANEHNGEAGRAASGRLEGCNLSGDFAPNVLGYRLSIDDCRT